MPSAISFAIRWADNTEELKKNLKEGLSQIEATHAAVDKMAQSLGGDKLLRAAHNMAAAIEKIGGATKLTGVQQERVNTLMNKALDQYRALGKEAPSAITQIAEATKKQEPPAQSWLSKLTDVHNAFRALIALGVVRWLSSLATAALGYADALGKMKASTDIGFQGLQRLENIAAGSDTTLQALTSSVLDLQRRLATGDDSAAGALKKLGFSLEAFLALKGDEQFLAIARKLGAMQDSTERNELAFRLFGRSYKEIISALVSDVDGLADSVATASDAQVEDVAKMEDEWVKMKLALSRAGLQAISLLAQFDRATQSIKNQKLHVSELSAAWDVLRGKQNLPRLPGAPSAFTTTTLPTVAGMPGEAELKAIYRDLDDGLKKTTQSLKDSAQATAEDTREKERNLSAVRALELGTTQLSSSIAVWRFQLVEAIDPAEGVRFHVRAIEDATVGLTAATRKLIPGLVTVNGRLADIEDASVATAGDLTHLGNVVEDVGLKTSTFDDDLEDLAKGFATLAQISGDSFAGAVRDVANVVAAWSLARTAADQYRTATTNAGRAAALAAGAAAVGQATGSGSTGSRVSGGAVTGASVGSIFGPVGTAVGAGVGALVGWIRGHRDAAKAMEALRQEGQQLINAAGGINDLAQRALGAGTGISALLDAMNSDNPEKLRAELIRLTTAIDFQDQAMQTLDETVAKYNFTVAEKGPALALREQAKTAERLYKDWQVLLTAGVDVNAVAREMGGSINAFVQNAMVMGQEVPEEMRAIILKMIELGQLTDADGKKITSLEETGITFSESMTAGVNRIVVAVEKLIAAITRGLTQAIENVPDIEVDRVVTTTYTEEPRSGDDAGTASGRPEGAATGGRVTLRGLQRFASGGVVLPWPMQPRGTDTVPIMATPGEVILNRGQQEAVGDRLAAAGSRQTITIDNRILLDGQEMKRWQRDTFVQDAEDNVGGFRTRAQDALGVAS